MKINKYMKESFAKQFGMMTVFIIISFCALTIGMMMYQNKVISTFEKQGNILENKERVASNLYDGFNNTFSEVRAHFAFGNSKDKSHIRNALSEKGEIQRGITELKKAAETTDDTLFINEAEAFYSYYFDERLPKSLELFDKGNKEEVINISNNGGTAKINQFQSSLKQYKEDLEQKLDANHEQFSNRLFVGQLIFLGAFFLIIIIVVISVRVMLRKIGGPLAKLTKAAGQIADGQSIIFIDETNREDELGLLSTAFGKMSKSIQEKEQDLNAQNEELIAQQDELQAQQIELQAALNTMKSRELELERRNELVNGISNSLVKQEVLTSIVKTMCRLIEADKGLIVSLDRDKEYASIGISKAGVKQIIDHLHDGAIERLIETKESYIVRRESTAVEKGYHDTVSHTFDLYIPVISSSNNVEAVMIFTRYDKNFKNEEIMQFETLAKQVAISLEKIKLYELSEEDRILTQDILNTINEGIQLVDVDGSILQVNKKMCDLLDGKHMNLTSQPFDKWIVHLADTVEDKNQFIQFFKNVIFEGNEEDIEYTYHQTGINKRVIKVYVKPLYRGDIKTGIVIVHRDITWEYEVDKMKSEFVSTVSHELRTPLASVLGFTELMLNRELKPERQKKYLTTIYQEAKRLTSLINDFLDVQRMEAEKQAYDKKYEDIIPLIRNVIDIQQVQTSKHQINLISNTENTMILGDKHKITQVINNLLSNAMKYSPDGGDIGITVYEEGPVLKVDIKDEGLGIPADAIDKLFTKFYRVDNSDRRQIGGTGLGLVIVKEIMQAHDGEVTLTSELKKGSTFTISFPLVIGLAAKQNERLISENNGKVNVIIVEDDINLANLLTTELEESNFNVQVFSDGETALNAIKEERPDAIVLDIMLQETGVTGWDIIKELKEIESLKSIPIFISSALDEKEKGLALGANDYLVKPYQPSKLSKLILQTLLKKDWNGQIMVPAKDENGAD
ncbi:ATP-binding protein [Metabacillus fastidiosus]|uniref:ATP-binding protein n=1 Tax=Metabacillus fastidiosus TaxID=1458 RepID=UPI003D2E07C0